MADARETRRKIKKVLLDLMKTKDADKITAAELARTAEISRATFYRYYDSVDAVLREITDDFLEEMRDEYRYFISTPIDFKNLDEPQEIFVKLGAALQRNSDVFLSMTGYHGDGRFVRKWHELFKEFYYGKLVYENLATKDLDVYIQFMLPGIDAVIQYWLSKKGDQTAVEGAPILQRVLFGPFLC